MASRVVVSVYASATGVAKWTFPNLPDGKYAIKLWDPLSDENAGIIDAQGNPLDAEWLNDPGEDGWDKLAGDPTGRQFLTIGLAAPPVSVETMTSLPRERNATDGSVERSATRQAR